MAAEESFSRHIFCNPKENRDIKISFCDGFNKPFSRTYVCGSGKFTSLDIYVYILGQGTYVHESSYFCVCRTLVIWCGILMYLWCRQERVEGWKAYKSHLLSAREAIVGGNVVVALYFLAWKRLWNGFSGKILLIYIDKNTSIFIFLSLFTISSIIYIKFALELLCFSSDFAGNGAISYCDNGGKRSTPSQV